MPAVNYAVRLRASYEALATTVADWATRSGKVLCYEHPEENNVHCHFLLYGVYDSVDTLKRDMRTHGIDLKGAGQLSFKTSFKLKDGTKVDINDETLPKYITYMSKGKYDPKYNKGYDSEYLQSCKEKWINHIRDPIHIQRYHEFIQYVFDEEKKILPVRGQAPLSAIHCYACMFIKQKDGYIRMPQRKEIKDLKDNYALDHDLMSWSSFALPMESDIHLRNRLRDTN